MDNKYYEGFESSSQYYNGKTEVIKERLNLELQYKYLNAWMCHCEFGVSQN